MYVVFLETSFDTAKDGLTYDVTTVTVVEADKYWYLHGEGEHSTLDYTPVEPYVGAWPGTGAYKA
jgi:hypothetical protein